MGKLFIDQMTVGLFFWSGLNANLTFLSIDEDDDIFRCSSLDFYGIKP